MPLVYAPRTFGSKMFCQKTFAHLLRGAFRAAGPVTAATGKLAGATGDLTFAGVENLSDGSFVEDVTGAIYVDLAP